MDIDPPLTLFINDASEILLPIVRHGSDVSIASVSFGVWTAKTGGSQIGSDHAMAWDASVSQYAGTFPASEASGLTETDIGGPFYWVRIVGTTYTDRRIKCQAVYRGQE